MRNLNSTTSRMKKCKKIGWRQPRKALRLSFSCWLCCCFPVAAADAALATALPTSIEDAFCVNSLVPVGTTTRIDTGPPRAPMYKARRERRHELWQAHCHLLTEKTMPSISSWRRSWPCNPMFLGICLVGLCGEFFSRFVLFLVLAKQIWVRNRTPRTLCNHQKVRRTSAPSWHNLTKRNGPWRAAYRRWVNGGIGPTPARRCGRKRVKGLHGMIGLFHSWRKSPCCTAAAEHRKVVNHCFSYLVHRSFIQSKRRVLFAPGSLRGGANGSASTARKRQEKSSHVSLASALSEFLQNWNQKPAPQQSPKRQTFYGIASDSVWHCI